MTERGGIARLSCQTPALRSVFVSIEVSIPACHAGDPGSIPGRRALAHGPPPGRPPCVDPPPWTSRAYPPLPDPLGEPTGCPLLGSCPLVPVKAAPSDWLLFEAAPSDRLLFAGAVVLAAQYFPVLISNSYSQYSLLGDSELQNGRTLLQTANGAFVR
ncbi:hypothetical protein O181_066924 [Austropuccinia psidii MF-1]|uniref:Uncharacterized protein n=1 Tax=Austropuccinia psidii MF-1 TaxID=1389203 RepID=A0A9Q3EUE0_9BASI|nr:hypothetical protein [Austropuccinia psidii MF-1]